MAHCPLTMTISALPCLQSTQCYSPPAVESRMACGMWQSQAFRSRFFNREAATILPPSLPNCIVGKTFLKRDDPCGASHGKPGPRILCRRAPRKRLPTEFSHGQKRSHFEPDHQRPPFKRIIIIIIIIVNGNK
jgi:hypothetical protein